MVLDSKEMLLPANPGHHKGMPCLQHPVSQSLKENLSPAEQRRTQLQEAELESGTLIRSQCGTGLEGLTGPSLGALAL